MRDRATRKPTRVRRRLTRTAASAGRSSAASADVVEARETAHAAARAGARAADPRRPLDAARDVTPRSGGDPAGEREQLAACLRALASLLRDIGDPGAGGDAAALANADLRRSCSALADRLRQRSDARRYAAVDEALAALERNASPKIVADWLVLRPGSGDDRA